MLIVSNFGHCPFVYMKFDSQNKNDGFIDQKRNVCFCYCNASPQRERKSRQIGHLKDENTTYQLHHIASI